MITWVLYDVKKDKPRGKIAKACKQVGLYRVQYSCFLGNLNENEKDELALEIKDLIDEKVDKIYIFRMNRDQLKECVMLGQAFDQKLVTDEIKSLFF